MRYPPLCRSWRCRATLVVAMGFAACRGEADRPDWLDEGGGPTACGLRFCPSEAWRVPSRVVAAGRLLLEEKGGAAWADATCEAMPPLVLRLAGNGGLGALDLLAAERWLQGDPPGSSELFFGRAAHSPAAFRVTRELDGTHRLEALIRVASFRVAIHGVDSLPDPADPAARWEPLLRAFQDDGERCRIGDQ